MTKDSKRCVALEQTFRIDPGAVYLVENRTPHDIDVDRGPRRLVLPGLGTRVMAGARLACFEADLLRLRQGHHLRIRRNVETPLHALVAGVIALVAFLTLPGVVIVRFVQDGTLLDALTGWLLLAGAIVSAVAATYWFVADHHYRARQEQADRDDGDVALASSGASASETNMGRRLSSAGVVLVMAALGAVLPATWMYFGTDLHEIVSFDGGLSVADGGAAEAAWRSIQMTYVAILVTLPAMLYFLFDRVHVGSLSHQWSRDLFQLDPRLETLADVQARYGHKLAEATRRSSSSVRLLGRKRSPIIVATVLFAVGWTLLILPTRARDVTEEVAADRAAVAADAAEAAADVATGTDDPAERAAAAQEAEVAAIIAAEAAGAATDGALGNSASVPESALGPGGLPTASLEEQATADAEAAREAAVAAKVAVDESGGGGRFEIFDPDPSAASAAFLGAYFFSLFVTLRGFFRRDLRPKMYAAMAARVAITASVAFLVVAVTPWGEATPMIALAFLGGIMPVPVITAVVLAPVRLVAGPLGGKADAAAAVVEGKPKGRRVRRLTEQVDSAMSDRRPLTHLDHVDIFERARLEGEGLGDLEALAHSEIVDLMVSTRIATVRLVDWIDQAVLMVHVDPPSSSAEPSDRVVALRRLGVRTATDLVTLLDEIRDPACDYGTEALGGLVGVFESRAALEGTLRAIRAEANFDQLLHWRHSPLGRLDADRPVLGADGLLHMRPSRFAEEFVLVS